MALPDYCTNELKFRICTNCKNIHYKVTKRWENVNVDMNVLLTFAIFFTIKAFINVYYYFWTFNTYCALPLC